MQDELTQIVQRMIDAGESEDDIALVIREFKPATASKEGQPLPRQAPGTMAGPAGLVPRDRRGEGARSTLQLAKDNPGTAGALLAGAAAAPLTGGLSFPAAMAAEGAVGAGGAIAGHGVKAAATGEAPDFGDVASDALINGVAGAAGPVIGGGLRMLGRGLYRAGVLPIQQVLGKYGNVGATGVENRILATKGKYGLEKAGQIKGERIATKKAAIDEASERVGFSAKGVADTARKQMGGKVDALKDAGEVADDAVFDTPLSRFEQRNAGGMTPQKLEGVKSTLDDRLGGAYKKQRGREPLTPREESRMALSQSASRALESAVPDYRQMNRGIMDIVGLEKALSRRVEGSAGNQGLENALTMAIGPAAVPARLAMLPPVMTGMGIAANEAGKVAQPSMATLIRAALLSLLSGESQEPQ
jgi:hypothetical protein